MFLSDTAIKRPVFTAMVMASLFIFGFLAWKNMGVDLYPRVEVPVVTVLSILPGADPETVEKRVSKPIEDALSTLSSIKKLRSTSGESVSQVVLEFELEKNIDTAFQEVQAKLGGVRSELPQDLDEPIVQKFDIDSSPVMAVVLFSKKQNIQALSTLPDTLVKTRLQQVKNVGEVSLVGKRDRTIWISVDPAKLQGFGLSVPEVLVALKTHNIEVPCGRIETGSKEIVVKTRAEFSNVSQFNSLLIGYKEGYPIRLSDIGEAVDGLEEERSSATLNGQKAISFLVKKQSGTNTVELAHALKAQVEKLREELSSQGVSLEIAQDSSLFIEQSIHDIQFHLIFGGGLAILIVFLFLRNRTMTLISALAIPLSVVSSFMFMNMLGFTMNRMTMLALSLAIGILIDDAIVVVENIFRHFKKGGESPQEAARAGSQEIGLAAFAITMSIVAVFLPVAFMKGMVGRFFYQFGVTVTVAVLMSLFVAFTLVPMLSSKFLRKEKERGGGSFLQLIEKAYVALLKKALESRKLILLVACASLVCALFSVKFIKSEFMPTEDQGEFFIRVATPLGSSLAFTEKTLSSIRERMSKENWVKYIFTTIGSGNMRRVNEGALYVKMVDKRVISQQQAMEAARGALAAIPLVKTSVEPAQAVSAGFRKNCSLQMDVSGPNFQKLESTVQKIVRELQSRAGYVDIDTSYEKDSPELSVSIKRERAAALEVTPADIAQTMRAMVGGITASTFNEEGERHDVIVRAQEEARNTLDSVLRLSVRNARGELIPLENLVEISQTKGPVQIDRVNKERVISIFINLQLGKKSLGEAVSEIKDLMQKMEVPPGYHYAFSGMADAMKESFQNLLFALCLAVVMVYMVLASQFESFTQPLVIMLSLPFALVGALFGILFSFSTLNINTIIGIIMLMGLVTKNAILLVDYTNTLRRRDGTSIYDALIIAGATRLHPILMTTAAMIFGMLPIALSHGLGSESNSPMAIAIIGGLITSTFLTLIVVPVVYSLIERSEPLELCEQSMYTS